jgi:ABC-type bacteriocin/lantibiotic exporter with double-glycine peptidase domain
LPDRISGGRRRKTEGLKNFIKVVLSSSSLPKSFARKMSEYMPYKMPDKMSEYMSDRMSEHMSVRMSVSGDYSKKVILTFFFLLIFLLLLSLSSTFTAIHPYVLYLLGIFVSLMSQHLSSNVDKDKDSKTA